MLDSVNTMSRAFGDIVKDSALTLSEIGFEQKNDKIWLTFLKDQSGCCVKNPVHEGKDRSKKTSSGLLQERYESGSTQVGDSGGDKNVCILHIS